MSEKDHGILVSFAVHMTKRTPIIGGNWKMNTDLESGMLLAGSVADAVDCCECCDVVVYPPFPYLQSVETVLGQSKLCLGAQNMWFEGNGAFTGEVSGQMLIELGVTSVLVGHSERRHILGETDDLIAKKIHAVIELGIQAVLCVGETLEERENGSTLDIVLTQLKTGLSLVSSDSMEHVVIAYEPVWAIGTGKTASPDDAQTVHEAIANTIRIQYGGSVKPDNAAELFACPDIDGALVGGAALSADSFNAIVQAACAS